MHIVNLSIKMSWYFQFMADAFYIHRLSGLYVYAMLAHKLLAMAAAAG